jgi:enoyl-[acyl-carrier protein] reductase II
MRRIETKITKLFQIEHPILLPGMSWISTPQLVAAVSNAGGLGILATGPLSAEQTRKSIREIRKLTDKPFGIGATLLMPGAKENAEVALDEKVPVINFSLGKGEWLVERAHKYGAKVLVTVVNEKHAKSAENAGADALMVTGHEAAAHGGDVTSLVLAPSIARKSKLPVVCAGGIADGAGLLAMLSLGAEGVAMGSRFATTKESPLPENIKQAIVRQTETDTIYGKNFDGLYARVMKTDAAVKAMKRPMDPFTMVVKAFQAAKLVDLPLWKVLPGILVKYNQMYQLAQFGAATEKLMKATVDGDLDQGVQFVGQVQGLIQDIPTVDELMKRCIEEAMVEHERVGKRFLK